MKGLQRRNCKILVCILLCLTVIMTAIPFKNIKAAGNSITIEDLYTDKAMYTPGDNVLITAVINNASSDTVSETLTFDFYRLETKIASVNRNVSLPGNQKTEVSYSWIAPQRDYTGYVIKVMSNSGTGKTTAVDVSSNLSHFVRYGYSADFDMGETEEESRKLVEELSKDYHINAVQYYDWMWRHEKVVPDATASSWQDMFGNTISKNSITQRINSGHDLNQTAMAYQMAYMAREGYSSYGVKKSWGLYRNKNYNVDYDLNDLSSINNIDQLNFPLEGNPPSILYTFNPENKEWQDYMINQYKDAIDYVGFDGIHIDQMGSFWGDIDYFDYYGNYVDLKKTFASYVDAVKEQLDSEYGTGKYVTMNMVNGGTPQNDGFSSEYITKYADTDFSFSEIWENSQSYNDLKDFVEWNRSKTNKPIVVAAYMNQYDNYGDSYEAEGAVRNGLYVNTNYEGVTYVSGFDAAGDELAFTVNVPENNNYCLIFTYSNGTENRSTKDIYVDNTKVGEVNFDPTRTGMIPASPSWGAFSSENAFTALKTLTLTAGTHTVAVKQSGNGIGDVQIDKLTLGYFNEPSVRITDAALAAMGAFHIEMGTGLRTANSNDNYGHATMLAHPYYPKAFKMMTNSLSDAMKDYYDFITGYENLLFDEDVTASDGGLQNFEIAGHNVSGSGENGKIWVIPKNKGNDYSVLHLINLTSENNTLWRDSTAEPNALNNLSVKYYYTNNDSIEGIYLASPDNDDILSSELNYTYGNDAKGKFITFTIPSLKYWDMVYIKWTSKIATQTIEAEKMILSGVSKNTNHYGYSGEGFVDGYGDLYDSVTFDVTVDEDGYYTLKFRYSNATGSECSRALIVDNDNRGKVTFVPNDSWDSWRTIEKGTYLSKGSHRLVVLVTEQYGGFINLDNVEISPLLESAKSFYLNNWKDTCFIWKAADINPAQARLSDGPSIYELRHYNRTANGTYDTNLIKNYSMFLRNEASGEKYMNGSSFDSVGYIDVNGVLNTAYTKYDGNNLSVSINRNYAVVPNENFMIVEYEVTNNSLNQQRYSLLDMLHVNNDSNSNISATYQYNNNTIVTDMTAAGQPYIIYGAFNGVSAFQVANDSESNTYNMTCSPWVTYNAGGYLKNNSYVNARDISEAYKVDVVLNPNETQKYYFYLGVCETSSEVTSTITRIRSKSANGWISDVANDYSQWLAEGKRTSLPDDELNDAYDSILVFLKQAIVPGSYIDSNGNTVYKFASLPATTNPSAYSYKVWARDSAVTAMALDASGHTDEAEKYWLWLADRQFKNDEGYWKKPGTFWTCYWIWNNDPVSFVEPEYDSLGMFLIGAYRHYTELPAGEKQAFLDKIWDSYRLTADFVMTSIGPDGFGAADCSIWEEQTEYNTFTEALYAAGLNGAMELAKAKGLSELSDSYNGAASSIRSAIQRRAIDGYTGLYNSTDPDNDWWYYNRAVNPDGTPRNTVDSSTDVMFVYGLYDMQSKRSYGHYNKITATITGDEHGIARYQGDTFYTGKNSWDPGGTEALEDMPSWPQMSMWVSLMELYSSYRSMADRGYERLKWYVDRTNYGYMPAGECVSNVSLKPLNSTACEPITGAAYIIASLVYDDQFDTRIIPSQYNAGAYANISIHGGTSGDWAQWNYIPYYLDLPNENVDSERDISKVYLCNDDNYLYVRIDMDNKQLPGYQENNNLFDVTIYCEDFNQSESFRNQTIHGGNSDRKLAYAFTRSSDSDHFIKYTAGASGWTYSGDVAYTIQPQWDTESGRIEVAIPLSEMASYGSVAVNDWSNIIISIGNNTGNGWADADSMNIHYRVTSPVQQWLFGNSEY